MPANLKIWGPQAPDGVEWHSVTTRADGTEEWKWGGDPVKEASGQGFAQQMFLKKWLRNEPDAEVWRQVVDGGRTEADKRAQEMEAEQARVNRRKARKREEMAERRLMGTTVKRLAEAVNRVKGETAGAKVETQRAKGEDAPMVTKRELRAALKEFLGDATKDKAFENAREFRQWLWTDRNTVNLAPAGRRKSGGQGVGGRVTGSGKRD
jgi:hypothetical protein